jgi:hypothetical protein
MNIYIGYKLSNLPENEKRELQPLLEKISGFVEKSGHKTFIMGRDVQKWSKEYSPSAKTIGEILKNMRNYDILLTLVNSDVKSTGLMFETVFARLTGKKIYALIHIDKRDRLIQKMANRIVFYTNENELESKIEQLFSDS